jgi:alpha-mannosidase
MLEGFHAGHLPGSLGLVEVITTAGDGAILATAIKGAEDAGPDGTCDLVVRLSETIGRAATAEVRLPIVGRTFSCELTAYQLRTFRVPADREQPIEEVNLIELDARRDNPAQPFRSGSCESVDRLRDDDLIIR